MNLIIHDEKFTRLLYLQKAKPNSNNFPPNNASNVCNNILSACHPFSPFNAIRGRNSNGKTIYMCNNPISKRFCLTLRCHCMCCYNSLVCFSYLVYSHWFVWPTGFEMRVGGMDVKGVSMCIITQCHVCLHEFQILSEVN